MYVFFLFLVPVVLPMTSVLMLLVTSPISPFAFRMEVGWFGLVVVTVLPLIALNVWGRWRNSDTSGSAAEKWFLRSVCLWLVIASYVVWRMGWRAFLVDEYWWTLAVGALQAGAWTCMGVLFAPGGSEMPPTLEQLAAQPAGNDQVERATAYCRGDSEKLARLARLLESKPTRGQMVELLEQLRIDRPKV